jgi:hypothetical protein
VNLFQMQLNETALFARPLHCHSVNKPHERGTTQFPCLGVHLKGSKAANHK